MIKRWLLAVLRVPPEPAPPEGSPGSIRVFNAGRNYFRWRLTLWAVLRLLILAAIIGVMFIPAPRKLPPEWVVLMWRAVQGFALVLFVVTIPVSYFRLRLDYEMRWYIVTDRSLRIRAGIWSVEEVTMTFANLQSIRVNAGPLQYLLGLADVEVSSAGGGTAGPHGSTARVARFSGVDNGETIRDLIAERLRQYRDTGLGDPDARVESAGDAGTAARAVLAEVRALRAVVSSRTGV